MTAKEILTAALAAEAELRILNEEYQHISDLATSAGRGSMDPSQAAPALADLTADMRREAEQYRQTIEQARVLIARLDNPNQRRVLTWHYICGLSWGEIQQRMHYSSRRSVIRIHKAALQACSSAGGSRQEQSGGL